jgi:hypothetical protein
MMMSFVPLPSIEIGGDEIDPNLQWPEVIAIALNSVVSEFCCRIYLTTDSVAEEALRNFKRLSTQYDALCETSTVTKG